MNTNDLKIISDYRTHIMGFAALWILMNHTWYFIFPSIPGLSFIENFIKQIGFCGVDIFFLLSGMGLINSIKKGTKEFYQHRFKRIIFTYMIASIFAFIIYRWNLLQYVQCVFFYRFFTDGIYTFLWFVPSIIILYLLFPIYYHFFHQSKNKNCFLVLSIIIWLIIAYLLKGHITDHLYGFINRIPIFLTGVWLGWFLEEKECKLNPFMIVLYSIILLIGLILAYFTNYKDLIIILPASTCIANYFITIPLTYILAYSFQQTHQKKYLSQFFEFYGTISLQLYCVQEMFNYFIKLLLVHFQVPTYFALLINVLFFVFITFISKRIYVLDQSFWNMIDSHKRRTI